MINNKIALFAIVIFASLNATVLKNTYITTAGNKGGWEAGEQPPYEGPYPAYGSAHWSDDNYMMAGGPGFPDSIVVTAGNGTSRFYVEDSAHFYNVCNDSFGAGDTLYIAPNADINIGSTQWNFMFDNFVIASSRGRTLGDTINWGGILRFGIGNEEPLKSYGDGLLITGLRIFGSCPHFVSEGDAHGTPQGITVYSSPGTVFENCEFMDCGLAGIMLGDGSINDTIRYCYFRNTRNRGCGYGVNISDGANAVIYANYFDGYRHAIASGVGDNNSYIAHHNYCDEHDVEWQSFDKHAASKGGDIHHCTWGAWQNTYNEVLAFKIQSGTPSESLTIDSCWSKHPDSSETFEIVGNSMTRISDIWYDTIPPTYHDSVVPVADGIADEDSAVAPLTVTFKENNSTDRNGTIAWQEWDFGIGDAVHRTRTDSCQYTYTTYGRYHWRYYVFDNHGNSDYEQGTVVVTPTGAAASDSFFLCFGYVDSYHDNVLGDSLMAYVLVDDDTVWEQSLNGDSAYINYAVNVTDEVGSSDSVTIKAWLVYNETPGTWNDISVIFDDFWMWRGEVLNGDFETNANGSNQAPDEWTMGHVSAGGGYFSWGQFMGETGSGRLSVMMRTTSPTSATKDDRCYLEQKIDIKGQ